MVYTTVFNTSGVAPIFALTITTYKMLAYLAGLRSERILSPINIHTLNIQPYYEFSFRSIQTSRRTLIH